MSEFFRIFPTKGCSVVSVPLWYAKRFQEQAIKNHSQDIDNLNSRGGLDPVEFYCISHALSWREHPPLSQCIEWLEKTHGLISEITALKEREAVLIELINELSKVRLYNSANIFKGPMIRDKVLVHDLVMKARKVMKDLEGDRPRNPKTKED